MQFEFYVGTNNKKFLNNYKFDVKKINKKINLLDVIKHTACKAPFRFPCAPTLNTFTVLAFETIVGNSFAHFS
jgi:hypothetical protein